MCGLVFIFVVLRYAIIVYGTYDLGFAPNFTDEWEGFTHGLATNRPFLFGTKAFLEYRTISLITKQQKQENLGSAHAKIWILSDLLGFTRFPPDVSSEVPSRGTRKAERNRNFLSSRTV